MHRKRQRNSPFCYGITKQRSGGRGHTPAHFRGSSYLVGVVDGRGHFILPLVFAGALGGRSLIKMSTEEHEVSTIKGGYKLPAMVSFGYHR